jgi:NAD(P)-dependent dehydrogenase (short-subunit alcohol dehydrogenase family)
MSDATSTTPHVLITGAAGALGRAVAQHFLEQGARLALVDTTRADWRKCSPASTTRSTCCSRAT